MSKLIFITAKILICMLFMLSVQAQAVNFKIGTGGIRGTYYPVGKGIAELVSVEKTTQNCQFVGGCGVHEVSIEAVSTGGSIQNVADVQSGSFDLGIGSAATVYFAYNGLGRFQGQPKPDLRILANLYPEDLHLVLSPTIELESIKDLIGKRVGIDKPSSGTQNAVEAILEKFRITRDDYKAHSVSSTESIKLMLQGKLDAFFYAAGTPVSGITKLSDELDIKLYSFTEDEIRKANEAVPYYIPSTIKAGVYGSVDYDVNTLAVSALLFTNANKPEPVIYNIVKAIWQDHGQEVLSNAHPKGDLIKLGSSLNGMEGLGIPLHTGAEKYYTTVCQFTVPRSPERYKRYPILCSR